MGSRILQYSFLGGLIAPAMLGRLDNALYQQGACELKNFIVEPTGAILSRPGFRYVAQVGEGDDIVRLIPFRFSSDQTLVIVFTDKKVRFITEGAWLLDDDDNIYEVESPYAAEDLFDIDYCQVADIITLTCVKYPPMELCRYGAADWAFEAVTTVATITPPSTVTVTAVYPEDTDEEDMDIVTVRYKVTAIDSDGVESVGSDPVEAKCNYWLTGAYNTISWSAVSGAERYNVYRDVAGVYGFLGQTDELSIDDEGDFTPDTTTTPPIYDNPFLDKTGIKEVIVVDGGSGYPDLDTALNTANPTTFDLKLPFLVRTASSSGTGLDDLFDMGSLDDTTEVTFEVLDGQTGTVLASDTVTYVLVASKTASGTSSGGWTTEEIQTESYGASTLAASDATGSVGLYLPENWENQDGNTLIEFSSYASSRAYFKCANAKFVEVFSDTGLDFSGSTTRSTSTGDTVSTYTVHVADIRSSGWTFHNGMTAQMFGLIGSRRLSSNLAGIEIADGNGVPMSQVLEETGDTLENLIAETEVTIEIDDPTGEGAVLEPVIQDGVIVSVTVVESGQNYTDPVLTVVSNQGSGAVLEAVLFDEDDYDYPGANTQFDQRRIFAGTNSNPLKVWMTNAGYQDLMYYHYPVLSTDRIVLTAVASDADRIRHAVALDSLLLFTGSGEFRVYTQNSDALSPNSVAVRAQSYIGCNQVQPVIVNSVVLFAANRGGHVRAVQYTYTTSGYTCQDLSMAACHLFDGKTIVDMTLAKAPSQIVWAVSSDGSLLGLTFTPEQNISAWHHHTTDGKFESVCVVTEGDEDHLYAVIAREINGETRKYVERMDNMVYEDAASARCLDSFIDNQAVAMSTNTPAELTGLDHLEGKTVEIFADGVDVGSAVVTNGKVTSPVTAENVAVGLPYTCRLITVPLAANAQGNMQGSVKNVQEVYFRVKFDGDVYANVYPGAKKLYLCKREHLDFSEQSQESKMVRVTLDGRWDYQGQVEVEHRNCLPLEIQAIVGNVSAEGVR